MADLKQTFLERVQAYGCKNENLAVNYFTRLDNELKKSNPAKTWKQINFEDFLAKSIAYANIGIDPLAPKMLSFTLFANKSNGLSDVVFIEDVRCMETLARRYGINCPENIKVELIYSTDKFSLIKKDLSNPQDSYVLEITNPFNRGEIIGGISYSEYKNPAYNKVRLMTVKDILKRKPKFANADFWGGEKDVWKDGKKTGEKEEVEGWIEDMYEKTIAKNAWSKVVLDTTQLAEYYAQKPTEEQEFEAENMENLPFDPDAKL